MTITPPKPTLLNVQLTHHDARFILEALQMLEEKWLHINHTSLDEDEQAEYGMDAIDLHATRESIQTMAIKAFGPGIANFSREPFAASSSPNGEHSRPR